jgi:5-(carboxyamino)imidazole ribonucleotide synthase
VTSQFAQQLRAVIGLPLGSTRLLTPVVMLNLLGDFWQDETTPPDWLPLFEDREISLHLYGKRHARGRRKMGHANIIGTTTEAALARAEALKARWLAEGAGAGE